MRVKHVMVSEDKSLCGRQTTQGEGRDCGNCARISDKNSAKVAAMVPRGNGLVDDTLPALTDADVIAYGMDAADISEYNAQRAAEIKTTGNPGDVWTIEQIEARAAAEQPIREAYRAAQRSAEPDTSVKPAQPRPAQPVPTPPAIEGFYWARHNGHTSVENGTDVKATDTYQLIKNGTTCQVVATISHTSGFRWIPSGCWFGSTMLCPTWDGVSLADAFNRIQTYVQECEWAAAGTYSDRMSAGQNARRGQAFTSREDMARDVSDAIEASGTCVPASDHFDVDAIVTTIIAYYGRTDINNVPTPDFWSIVAENARPAAEPVKVGTIKTPVRANLGKRNRKAIKRGKKHAFAR